MSARQYVLSICGSVECGVSDRRDCCHYNTTSIRIRVIFLVVLPGTAAAGWFLWYYRWPDARRLSAVIQFCRCPTARFCIREVRQSAWRTAFFEGGGVTQWFTDVSNMTKPWLCTKKSNAKLLNILCWSPIFFSVVYLYFINNNPSKTVTNKNKQRSVIEIVLSLVAKSYEISLARTPVVNKAMLWAIRGISKLKMKDFTMSQSMRQRFYDQPFYTQNLSANLLSTAIP